MREQEYKLEDIEFKGKAYKRLGKKVINGGTSGVLHVPARFIKQEFDVILIPKEKNERKEVDKGEVKGTQG